VVDHALLERHFHATRADDIVGAHTLSPGPDGTGLYIAIDIDKHKADDSADPENNLEYAMMVWHRLVGLGFHPVLYPSNGKGGYHVVVFFACPVPGATLYRLAKWVARDHATYRVPTVETFPKQPCAREYGNWIRLIGRHHTREHWPDVWNGSGWLSGEDAVAYVLGLVGDDPALIPTNLPEAETKKTKEPRSRSNTRKPTPSESLSVGGSKIDRSYGRAGLDVQCERVRAAQPGNLHHTLVSAASSVGRLIVNHLTWESAEADLLQAAKDAGAEDLDRARQTIRGQLEFGMGDPVPKNPKPRAAGEPVGSNETAEWNDAAEDLPMVKIPVAPNDSAGVNSLDEYPPTEVPAQTDESAFEFESLAGVKAKPVKWLVPGRIPLGKVTLVAGDGGLGKSTLIRHLAAKLTKGEPAFGLDYTMTRPGRILLCAAEDSIEEVMIPHFIAEGADLDEVHTVKHISTEPRTGEKSKIHLGLEHIAELRDELIQRPEICLVIIDPFASFVARARIDDHKQSELRKVLDPLADLAEKTNVAVIVIVHLNKGTTDKAAYRIAGSVGYTAAVRLAYIVAADPDDGDRRFLLPVKKNLLGIEKQAAAFRLESLSEEEIAANRDHSSFAELTDEDFAEVAVQMTRVKFEANVDATADDVMRRKPDGKDPTKVAQCADWMKSFLAEFACSSKGILEAATKLGFTFDNVKKAKTSLKDDDLQNCNRGRFQGAWWSGFGHPSEWKIRPDSSGSAPRFPECSLSPSSHPTPHTGENPNPDDQAAECGETEESLRTGDSGVQQNIDDEQTQRTGRPKSGQQEPGDDLHPDDEPLLRTGRSKPFPARKKSRRVTGS